MLSVITTLGLGLVVLYNWNFVAFIVDAEVTHYSELFSVIDTREPNAMEDYIENIMISRFYTILWVDGYISEEGVLREGVKINGMSFSTDKEYMRAHYTVDGVDKDFFTRFPWKSMPQRKYEAHCLPPKPHPLSTP